MTIEEKLKDLILSEYGSLRNFTMLVGLPYSTVDGMLKRGIQNATVSNVLTICAALGISADELGQGRIVPVANPKHKVLTDLESIIDVQRMNIQQCGTLTIDGKPLTKHDIAVLFDAIDVGVEIVKRHRERTKCNK